MFIIKLVMMQLQMSVTTVFDGFIILSMELAQLGIVNVTYKNVTVDVTNNDKSWLFCISTICELEFFDAL